MHSLLKAATVPEGMLTTGGLGLGLGEDETGGLGEVGTGEGEGVGEAGGLGEVGTGEGEGEGEAPGPCNAAWQQQVRVSGPSGR